MIYIKKILFTMLILLVSLFLYGRYIEPNNIKTHYYTISDDGIPTSFEELKIVQFSDILYSKKSNKNKISDTIKLLNKENADIVVFNGDLFKKDEKYNEDDYNFLLELFKSVNANLYKYAVIGDNDKYFLENYKDILYESNFNLLDNQNTLLFYKDVTPINIVGLTDTSKQDELFNSEISYNYSIVISHEPDIFKYINSNTNFTLLAGHSLGGIINVPYYGGIIKSDGAKTYVYGNYKNKNNNLFITNGIGYKHIDFRLLNNPSINVFKLKKSK